MSAFDRMRPLSQSMAWAHELMHGYMPDHWVDLYDVKVRSMTDTLRDHEAQPLSPEEFALQLSKNDIQIMLNTSFLDAQKADWLSVLHQEESEDDRILALKRLWDGNSYFKVQVSSLRPYDQAVIERSQAALDLRFAAAVLSGDRGKALLAAEQGALVDWSKNDDTTKKLILENQRELVRLVLKNGPRRPKREVPQDVIALAIRQGRSEIAEMLLSAAQKGSVDPQALLMEAVVKGDLALAKQLVRDPGIDLNKKVRLVIDAGCEGTALSEAAFRGDVAMVKLLVAQDKIDLNAETVCFGRSSETFQTPMSLAAKAGKLKVVRVLVQSGVKIDGTRALCQLFRRDDAQLSASVASQTRIDPQIINGFEGRAIGESCLSDNQLGGYRSSSRKWSTVGLGISRGHTAAIRALAERNLLFPRYLAYESQKSQVMEERGSKDALERLNAKELADELDRDEVSEILGRIE